MPLQVELVSPERTGFSGEAKMVVARTTEGDIAFLNGHVPFIGVLDIHPVRVIAEDGTTYVIAVHHGFVEVSPPDSDGNSHVTILSDVAEVADVIDLPRAEAARERALARIAADPEDSDAQGALKRAEVRIHVAASR